MAGRCAEYKKKFAVNNIHFELGCNFPLLSAKVLHVALGKYYGFALHLQFLNVVQNKIRVIKEKLCLIASQTFGDECVLIVGNYYRSIYPPLLDIRKLIILTLSLLPNILQSFYISDSPSLFVSLLYNFYEGYIKFTTFL
jgi:hypothetical protein